MNKQILRLAIPNILSNLSVPLLSVVDTALVGHLDGLHFLGAVALGSMIFNFIYWGFGFLRMGTTGLTAQAYGNDDQPKANTTLYRALLIAIISALALLLLASPIAMLSFYLIDGSAEVETYAKSYFFIRIWAAPATLLLFVVHGWFLGMQNARFPLYLSLTVNSLNIVFSVFFVQVLGWNADGVAMGTVCAQYFGLLMAGLMLLYRYRPYLTALRIGDILQQEAMKQFLSLNPGHLYSHTLSGLCLCIFHSPGSRLWRRYSGSIQHTVTAVVRAGSLHRWLCFRGREPGRQIHRGAG